MTFVLSVMQLLKSDSVGRGQPRSLPRPDFERSGVEFAKHIGVKYPTLAGWLRRRRFRSPSSQRIGRPRTKPVEFIEAVFPGSKLDGLTVELPRTVRVQITNSSQIPLVIELPQPPRQALVGEVSIHTRVCKNPRISSGRLPIVISKCFSTSTGLLLSFWAMKLSQK